MYNGLRAVSSDGRVPPKKRQFTGVICCGSRGFESLTAFNPLYKVGGIIKWYNM